MDNTTKHHLLLKNGYMKVSVFFSKLCIWPVLYFKPKKQQVVHILFSQFCVQKKIIFFPKNKKRKHHMHTRGLLTSAFNCIPTHSQCSFYLLMTSYQMSLSSSCKLLHASSYKTSCASPEIPHICHFIMDSIIGIPAEGYDEGGAIPHVCMTLVTLGN